MDTATGFSMPYHTLAVSLKIAFIEYLRFLEQFGDEGDWFSKNLESHEALQARAITVVILSAAVCESAINSYLGTKLEDQVANIKDRRPPEKKWRLAPKHFYPGYHIPKESQLDSDLTALFECRNYIMHARSDIFVGEEKVQKGNHDAMSQVDHGCLRRFYRLPVDLLINLEQHDMVAAMHRSVLAPTLFVAPPNPPIDWF